MMALIKSPLITIGRNPHRLVNRGLSNKVINALQLAMVTSHSISVVGTVGKARLSWGMIPVITVVMPVTVERLRILMVVVNRGCMAYASNQFLIHCKTPCSWFVPVVVLATAVTAG